MFYATERKISGSSITLSKAKGGSSDFWNQGRINPQHYSRLHGGPVESSTSSSSSIYSQRLASQMRASPWDNLEAWGQREVEERSSYLDNEATENTGWGRAWGQPCLENCLAVEIWPVQKEAVQNFQVSLPDKSIFRQLFLLASDLQVQGST